jgi:hypothetical protein
MVPCIWSYNLKRNHILHFTSNYTLPCRSGISQVIQLKIRLLSQDDLLLMDFYINSDQLKIPLAAGISSNGRALHVLWHCKSLVEPGYHHYGTPCWNMMTIKWSQSANYYNLSKLYDCWSDEWGECSTDHWSQYSGNVLIKFIMLWGI